MPPPFFVCCCAFSGSRQHPHIYFCVYCVYASFSFFLPCTLLHACISRFFPVQQGIFHVRTSCFSCTLLHACIRVFFLCSRAFFMSAPLVFLAGDAAVHIFTQIFRISTRTCRKSCVFCGNQCPCSFTFSVFCLLRGASCVFFTLRPLFIPCALLHACIPRVFPCSRAFFMSAPLVFLAGGAAVHIFTQIFRISTRTCRKSCVFCGNSCGTFCQYSFF